MTGFVETMKDLGCSRRRGIILSLVGVCLVVNFSGVYQNDKITTTIRENYRMRPPVPVDRKLQDVQSANSLMLNSEAPIGHGQATTVLLGIFTTKTEEERSRRDIIRKTYLQNENGKWCTLNEYKKQIHDAHSFVVKCQIPYVFVVGSAPTRPTEHNDDAPLLTQPPEWFTEDEDVIHLNIKENMEDGKSVSYFKYASSLSDEFGIDYMAKTDSDTLISSELFQKFIEAELPPKPFNRRIYGGQSMANYDRNSIYAAGEFYFMSSDLANYVSNVLTAGQREKFTAGGKVTAFRPIEDVDMGTFVFSHPRPVKFISLTPHQFWVHGLKTESDWMDWWNNNMWKLPRSHSVLPFGHFCKNWGFL